MSDELQVCRAGSFVAEQTCAQACVATLGCVACQPGEGTCEGDSERVCKDDGSGFELRACDPVQGTHCEPGAGRCTGACSSQALGKSYIGCEYFPTATANSLLGEWDFGVIISNTGTATANVRLEGGMLTNAQTFTVAPGAVAVRRLPYDPDLRFCNSTLGDWCTVPQPYGTLARQGAYHLRSDQPVTVYQFNPLDYVKSGPTYSHTNDASLLLPTTSLRGEYVAASWPTWGTPERVAYPGTVAITATRDGTAVTVTTSASAAPLSFEAGVPKTVMLDRGDVLELASVGNDADLTGTQISATEPVQVIGGHFCTYIPHDKAACDHLEESIFPTETLGTSFAVAAPRAGSLSRAPFLTRVIGIEDGTQLVFDPPLPGVPATVSAGRFVEIEDPGHDFLVTANKRINVVQYMLGETVVGTGDPSMTQAVPTDQWRTRYLFHAPTNYETSFVTIVAPLTASISLDGTAVTDWTPIGASGLRVARVQLGAGAGGDHEIIGNESFGITVYGYGRYTSYWYPGGLDLETLIIL